MVRHMKRTIVIYGLSLAALVLALKLLEYRYFIRDLSLEFYVSTVAMVFAFLGVWVGWRLTRPKVVLVSTPFVFDESLLDRYDISKREYEVLQLMAQGLSNQQIADKLFVSINTVKTHSSNLFMKLDANRRTEAIRKGKELRLIG